MNKLILVLFLGILSISFVIGADSIKGTSGVEFRNTPDWNCVQTSSSSYWSNFMTNENLSIMLNDVSVSGGNCSKYFLDSSSTCCPLDKPYCWSNGECNSGGEFCGNYNSAMSCTGANSGNSKVGLNSVNNGLAICGTSGEGVDYDVLGSLVYGPLTCFNYTSCTCAWNGTSCNARTAPAKYCQNDTFGFTQEYDGYCTFIAPVGLDSLVCDASGHMTYISKANWTGSATSTSLAKQNCLDIVRDYTCPETAKLPFFGIFNLLISVILIGVIYFFYRRN